MGQPTTMDIEVDRSEKKQQAEESVQEKLSTLFRKTPKLTNYSMTWHFGYKN